MSKVNYVFWPLIITLTLSHSLPSIAQTTTPNQNSEPQQLPAANQKLQEEKLNREIEKLQQETLKLKKETENLDKDFWEEHSSLANMITAIVAIVGAFFTIYQQQAETRLEKKQHIDERFTSIVQDLGSEQAEIKASATVSLLTFLGKGYEKYHEQVYMIVLANLKLNSKDATINKLLVKTFEQVIEKYLKQELKNISEQEKKIKLDLSECHINGITLSGLSLNQANLSHAQLNNATLNNTFLTGANLQNADLSLASIKGTHLNQANLQNAIFNNYQSRSQSSQITEISNSNFEQARLISAKMTKVTITDTDLTSAQMQEVNLNGAVLKNVNFTKANLKAALFKGTSFTNVNFEEAQLENTNFLGAKFDELTLNSLAKNQFWKQAKFEHDIEGNLEFRI